MLRRTMDWKIFASTFATIFVAELGDKTQLAALSFSAGSVSKWTIFAATSLALIAASAMAIAGGEALSQIVSPLWLRRASGVLFLVMGIVFLVRAP